MYQTKKTLLCNPIILFHTFKASFEREGIPKVMDVGRKEIMVVSSKAVFHPMGSIIYM